MEFTNAKISVRQFQILIILGLTGDSILILPTIIASSARQNAWISMLIAYAVGLVLGGFFAAIANRMQGDSLLDASRRALGGWLGSVVGLLFLFNFFMCSLTLVSELSQFMTTQLMAETPVNAIILIFLTVVIVAYRYGIEAFARMGELLFPAFTALFMVLAILSLSQANIENVKPIAAEGLWPIVDGAIPVVSVAFVEMVVLLALVPYVATDKKLTKPIMKSFAAGGLFLFIVVGLCVLVLGPNLMETKYYPTFVLAQKIAVGNFLERLEAILAFLWIITVFYKTLLLFFALTSGLAHWLRLRESRMLTIPLGMIMLVLTVVGTPNITVYYQILKRYYNWFDLVFCFFVPLLLLIGLLVRKKKGKAASS
ncbi:endospore germination permease [Paenibacillus sp. NPDC057967]|uniref:GerAB/ArcD/ProY family transporter n=1 Tax=Paenibacillus sp. NPDC057967 TaxID=3346293 RepID=UPI0036DE3F2E